MIYLVYFYLFWSSFVEYFIKAGIPVISFIDELIVIILLIHFIIRRHEQSSPQVPFSRRIWIILLISTLSMIVNLAAPIGGLQFIFSFMKPIIVFYWVKTFVDDDRLLAFCVKLLLFLIIVQIPFFIYGIMSKGLSGYIGDYATGVVILGDAHQVGIYLWLGVVLSASYYFTSMHKMYLGTFIICFLLLVLTSTKQIILLLPLVLIFLLRQQLKLTINKILIFSFLICFTGYFLYRTVESNWLSNSGEYFENENYYDAFVGSEKIQGYYSAIYELPNEIPVPLLGAGPGQYGSYVGMTKRTTLSKKYIMDYNDIIPEGMEGTLTYRSSGLIGIYGDIGIVGLILLLSIYFSAIKISMNYATISIASFDKAIAFLASGAGILILAESLVQNIFEGNWFVLNFFWILTGGIIARRNYIHEQ